MALTAESIRPVQSMELVVLVPDVVTELELDEDDEDDVVLLVPEVALLTVMIWGPP
ncbi:MULTISPECIES: hypothetical protein [unclassified Bradyrhizobium]|uniref:hypothetical protein n=1 Tax=unclassified Bradyrhizobium TaxID=2631580 RepID=UPI0028E71184|nr:MULTISPECIES: hypothetical protein [unclassified Bradyrhizobium]